MPVSISLPKEWIQSRLFSSNDFILWVEQLPRRIQTTLGGKPKKEISSLESLSLKFTKMYTTMYCDQLLKDLAVRQSITKFPP